MILVIVPVARPQRIPALLESLHASQVDVSLLPFLVASRADEESLRACQASGEDFGVSSTELGPGDFAAKIDLAYRATEEPWLFQGAEDIEFTSGWAEAALETARITGALVIGTNDQGNPDVIRGNHSTHSLIARSYCDDPGASMDGPGTVFSSAYCHNWTDAELVGVAKSRGVWAFSAESVVRHNHPHWGKGEMDEIYELGLSQFDKDRAVFNQRRLLWTRGNARHRIGRRR